MYKLLLGFSFLVNYCALMQFSWRAWKGDGNCLFVDPFPLAGDDIGDPVSPLFLTNSCYKSSTLFYL
jgi:hypothetical protein